MANNVTLPPQGVGSLSPVVETIDTTGSGGPQRQVVALKGSLLTPTVGIASQVIAGGTAVVVARGPLNGGFVINPPSAAAQGLALAENAYLDMVASPGGSDSTANGTTVVLAPGGRFDLPGLASGVQVMVNAFTSGHKLTVNVW